MPNVSYCTYELEKRLRSALKRLVNEIHTYLIISCNQLYRCNCMRLHIMYV